MKRFLGYLPLILALIASMTYLALPGEQRQAAVTAAQSANATAARKTILASREVGADPQRLAPTSKPVPQPGPFGAGTKALANEGQRVYVADGPRLALFESSAARQPTRMGQTAPLPGDVLTLALFPPYALVALGSGGLAVVDVQDPASPQVVDAQRERTDAVVVADGYLYTTERSNYLRVYDLRDPTHLTLRGELALSTRQVIGAWNPARAIAVQGSTVYVAAGSAGLVIVDVANPEKPSLASTWQTPSPDVLGRGGNIAQTVFVKGNWVSIEFEGNGLYDRRGSIGVDVSDPRAPVSPRFGPK
jgi:hypothetical protein